MYEIFGAIISILLAAGSIIGYRTRSDIRPFLTDLLDLAKAGGALLYDLSIVLQNVKLVKKNVLPGIDPTYTLEFGNDVTAIKSLSDLPVHIKDVLAQLDELSEAIPNLGSILPKK